MTSTTQQRESVVSIHLFYFLSQLCDMSLPLGFNSTLYMALARQLLTVKPKYPLNSHEQSQTILNNKETGSCNLEV